MKKKQPPKPKTVDVPKEFGRVRKFALAMPGVEEGTSYGTPAFRVAGKFFARLHDKRDSLVIRIDERDRRMRMEAEPSTFFITDHYQNAPYMLIRLANVEDGDLEDLLREAWAMVAPARLIERFDA